MFIIAMILAIGQLSVSNAKGRIEVVNYENIDEVLPLIRQYQAFYHIKNISSSRNKTFFSQFIDDSSLGSQFLYREDQKVVAFATIYFTFASSITAKVGVLNDLYTLPQRRGCGIGKQLIEHCRAYVGKQGASRLQWLTAPDNDQAQRLYRSLDTHESTWNIYTYNCDR